MPQLFATERNDFSKTNFIHKEIDDAKRWTKYSVYAQNDWGEYTLYTERKI
jgi:hypothetical protein